MFIMEEQASWKLQLLQRWNIVYYIEILFHLQRWNKVSLLSTCQTCSERMVMEIHHKLLWHYALYGCFCICSFLRSDLFSFYYNLIYISVRCLAFFCSCLFLLLCEIPVCLKFVLQCFTCLIHSVQTYKLVDLRWK